MGWTKFLLSGAMVLVLGACTSLPPIERNPGSIPTFANEAEIDAYIAAQKREAKRLMAKPGSGYQEGVIIVTGSRMQEVAITNNQEEGIDEGGIVKATGEFLVILRRGRVHVVRYGGNALEPVSSVDAFAPGDPDPDDTWYDEMLLSGGMVVVIGYSFGEDGTEISRFKLSDEGALSYVDTHYLSSFDYYSSRNFASRMIDGELWTYSPSPFDEDWRDNLPFLERRLPDGSRERVGSNLKPEDMGLSASMLEHISPAADLMHGITRCTVLEPELTCTSRAVLGTESGEYYFSQNAAYLWTEEGRQSWRWRGLDEEESHVLYRIPYDHSDVTAIRVQGAPIDQFSFHEDDDTDSLFVLTQGEFTFGDSAGFGATMWDSEFSDGETALVRIPLDAMGNGTRAVPQGLFRDLPAPDGWRVQNRYVGRHLLYSGARYREEGESPEVFVTPLDAGWVQRIELDHGISRIDRLGKDGVVIGQDDEEQLGFSTIELGQAASPARLGTTSLLPASDEGENRSHAFYWRPNSASPESGDGMMALPVNKEIEGYDFEFLGSSTAMAFIERRNGKLEPIGELGTIPDESVIKAAQELQTLDEEGECKASCTDWYGNARPIFIDERVFALMGDQIVEGEISDGAIEEVRRINFAK
ncbi:MAG: beta-propeller domain-containing protein [Erythrobacter sp.]|uniref:beta-propeller domain-containing protein n=1 Tax=Erythrobacter sp. TaxID=1042 RepID=UPI003265098C